MTQGKDRSRQQSRQPDANLYQVLDELDRLEELLEDMEELGVSTRQEAEARMRELEQMAEQLDYG